MHHPLRRILVTTLVVGAFAALAGSGCAVTPRRGVVYAEGGYDGGYYQQQPAVVVAQPTYVQPTYVQPTYYEQPGYGYYQQQPARVIVAPQRGYYGRGYYAPGYDRRGGYYGGRQRVIVAPQGPRGRGYYAPGPSRGGYAPRRGPAVYVR